MSERTLLDWHRIYDWTLAQPEDRPLGTACINDQCPLAQYLLEQTGQPWYVVFGTCINEQGEELDMAPWMEGAILMVDRLHGTANTYERGPVTRTQFLDVLQQVKPLQG